MSIRKIIRNQIEDNAIVTAKLADNSIQSIDMAQVYFDTPRITTIYHYGDDTAAKSVGGNVSYITGYNFKSNATVYVGANVLSNVVLLNSSNIQIITPALYPGSYNLTVINPDGGVAMKIAGYLVSDYPVWITDGLLNPIRGNTFQTFAIATDQSYRYTVANGSILPSYLVLDSNTGIISGFVLDDVTANYNFVIEATDPENQTISRNFSLPVFNSRSKYEASFLLIGGGGAGGALPVSKGGGGGGAGGILTGNLVVGGEAGIPSIDIIVGYGGATADSAGTAADNLTIEVLAVGGGGGGGGAGVQPAPASSFNYTTGAGGGAAANTFTVGRNDTIIVSVGGSGTGNYFYGAGGPGGIGWDGASSGGGGGGFSGVYVNNSIRIAAGGGGGGSGKTGNLGSGATGNYPPTGGGSNLANVGIGNIQGGTGFNTPPFPPSARAGWGGGGGGVWGGSAGVGSGGVAPSGGGNFPSTGNSFIGSSGISTRNIGPGGNSANVPADLRLAFGYSNFSYGQGTSDNFARAETYNNGIVIIRYAGLQRAIGGTVTQANGYTYHTFTTLGNSYFIANVSYERNGGNTYFIVGANTYLARGGGAGGDAANIGNPGGSGGGGGGGIATAGTGRAGGTALQANNSPIGWYGYGFAGGAGNDNVGGGGGGTSETGFTTGADEEGKGGNGSILFASWSTATGLGRNLRFAAGGGGGLSAVGLVTQGGIGGGGYGGFRSNAALGIGSGGGGAGRPGTPTDLGGAGSPGAVFIRYPGRQIGSGGNVISSGGMTYHIFTSPGRFTA
jgi:hypothetical protein